MTSTAKEKLEERPDQVSETTPVVDKKTRAKRIAKQVFITAAAIVLVFGVVSTGYAFYYRDKVLPRVQVAGLRLSGATQAEAQQRLAGHIATALAQPLTLKAELEEIQTTQADMGVSVDTNALATEAYAYGRTGSYGQQLFALFKAPFVPYRLAARPALGDPVADSTYQKEVLAKLEQLPSETTVVFTAGKPEVVAGVAGRRVNTENLLTQLAQHLAGDTETITVRTEAFIPQITTEQATLVQKQAEVLISSPWKVTFSDKVFDLGVAELIPMVEAKQIKDSQGISSLVLALKPEAVTAYLQSLTPKVERKAANATLKQQGGVVVVATEGVDGLVLDQALTTQRLTEGLLAISPSATRTIEGVATVTRPELRSDTLASLGIKELIGTATTDFSGSPVNRKYNIGVGQRALSGGLLKPGEVYSTTGTLGPVEESTGYLPELVIKGDRTFAEAGGGLCQVSTTLFRAVLNAGLPITERSNHAYRVGYYEREVGPGLDATVYIPNPDLKWRNDFASTVYVNSYIVGDKITFELFGTKDGRSSAISPVTILEETPAGDPIYRETDTMAKGEQRQIETAHSGAKTVVTYVVTKDGKEINRQDFRSTYRPWPAQFLIGTR